MKRGIENVTAMLMGVVVCVCALPARSATLSLDVDADATTLAVSLVPGPEEFVGGLQFDVLFDPKVLEFKTVNPGAAAKQSDKDANFNLVAPGKLRVIIAGFNRNVVGEGVVAEAHFNPLRSSRSNAGLRLNNVVLSDPFGYEVATTIDPSNTNPLMGGAVSRPAKRPNDSPVTGPRWTSLLTLAAFVLLVVAAGWLAGRRVRNRHHV